MGHLAGPEQERRSWYLTEAQRVNRGAVPGGGRLGFVWGALDKRASSMVLLRVHRVFLASA